MEFMFIRFNNPNEYIRLNLNEVVFIELSISGVHRFRTHGKVADLCVCVCLCLITLRTTKIGMLMHAQVIQYPSIKSLMGVEKPFLTIYVLVHKESF